MLKSALIRVPARNIDSLKEHLKNTLDAKVVINTFEDVVLVCEYIDGTLKLPGYSEVITPERAMEIVNKNNLEGFYIENGELFVPHPGSNYRGGHNRSYRCKNVAIRYTTV